MEDGACKLNEWVLGSAECGRREAVIGGCSAVCGCDELGSLFFTRMGVMRAEPEGVIFPGGSYVYI